MRNRQQLSAPDSYHRTQQSSENTAEIFIVLTVRWQWPVARLWQQAELYKLANQFFYNRIGVMGPLIHVPGDMLPASDFLIIVPRTKVVTDMLISATEFMGQCQTLWALRLQLQLGRYAVLDTAGKPCPWSLSLKQSSWNWWNFS